MTMQETTQKDNEEKRICGKQILVCEGPSGSGKSSLLDRLKELPHINIVQSTLGKRGGFGKVEAAHKSALNDIRKLQYALIDPEPIIIIDRCMASQKVYHAIRTNSTITQAWGTQSYTLDLLYSLERDLAGRTDRDERNIELMWLFLIPNVKELKARRKISVKEYSNRAETEIRHYKSLSYELIHGGASALKPQYDTLEDQQFIVDSFKRWLTYYPYSDFENLWRSFAGLSKEDLDIPYR